MPDANLYANPVPGGPPLHYGDPLPPGWAWTGLGPIPPMGGLPGTSGPAAPQHPDARTFVAPGMADIFTPDLKAWLSSIPPGSFQFNSLPPMQKAWITAYNAAAPPAQPTGQGGMSGLHPPRPSDHPAPPITHSGVTPRPIGGGVVGNEQDPDPGWYNTTMNGVPVHTEPPVPAKHTVKPPAAASGVISHPIGGGQVVGPAGGARHVGGQVARVAGGQPPKSKPGKGKAAGYPVQPGPSRNLLRLSPAQRERVALRTILSALHAPSPDHTGIF